MSSQYRWSINLWQKHEAASCYNNYYRYKTEIEEKIDNFYRFKNRNVYTQWQDLNEYIKQKNNEIKNCDRKKRISLDLLEDDKIKGFKSSNAISSPSLETKGPVEAHTESKESKQLFVPSRAHQDPKHHGSLVQTEGGSTESLDIHYNAQSASFPALVTTTELSTQQISHSPSRSASEESDASNTSGEIDLKESIHLTGTSAGQTSDDNLHSLQSITGTTDGIQDLNNQTFPVEIKVGLRAPGSVVFSTKVGDENPLLTSIGDVSSSNTHTACTDTDKKNIPRSPTCDKTYSDRSTNSGNPGEFVGSEQVLAAGVLNAENGNKIDTDNASILDTLSGFFNGIPNNPQIIKTSAPVGIALLLGLLFKVN
ncbi:hypothetical protein PVNG_03851 [Plasmodium vivax North Korean]|uniref:Variable surface protein Vir18 n=1 Tax=Plasmodium vivax North Korean TaxID=1035514 RepID=A0A0J9TVZ2_PLAVI|nr:hypothetical protein PVNG_03851 [Plasmodium vivax North Korean]